MDKSKLYFLTIVLFFLFFSVFPASLSAGITNGYFSDDPAGTGWTFGSNVEVTSDSTAWDGNGTAVLRPDDEDEMSLSQLSQDGIFLLSTDIILSFDIVMFKSDSGGETDEFTATFGTHQYVLKSSDISGTLYEETITFDLAGWATGPYELSFSLDNDPDGIFTAVSIDNVHFIPAPGAFALVAMGAAFVGAFRKSRRIQI